MNTKTNHEYASNSYSGGGMGSDSPAALLDMLAEVASQTLHSEKKRTKSLLAPQCKPKVDFIKRKNQETFLNVPQLLSMPASQLVKQFSIFTSDELKRQYSYTCALVIGCGQKYTSFASEGRARMSIKAHLAEHLEYLKTNKEAYNSFTARSVNNKNCKINLQNKKTRLQQSKKPQETLNKENKNVTVEKSTNYLRSILLNDTSFKELDKHKSLEKTENSKKLHNFEQKGTNRIDFKVLGDHSYFERLKDEMPNGNETSSFNNVNDNGTPDENIVLMVVGTDSVHMKEYSHINQKLSENINQSSETVYLPDISWSDESCNRNVESTTTTKPKGKAKFIGTSKEEREMALAFMDHIKKKGNPAGSNLECRICNPPRSFTAPTTLVSHYRSHAGIKPYECRICRAVFTRRHSLKYHMLIHQNQTRFTCADCGKKFRHPSHFREHRRRHTGEAPFGCDDCGQRFKTRNTYKRHLKTRHGKVLTTTGELLYLSEEDFQKVRTNRKKRNDYNKEHVINEDIISTKAIINYQNDSTEQQHIADVTDGYIINEDLNNGGRNWEANNTIHMIKKCFETYEVQPESHLNKTEITETEMPIDNRISDSNENDTQVEYTEDKVQDNLTHLQNVSYNDLEVVEDEQSQIIYHDNVESQSELIYHDVTDTPSYIKVEYNNAIVDVAERDNVIEYQEGINFLENEMDSHSDVIQQNDEDYCNDIPNVAGEQNTEYIHNTQEIQSHSVEINTHVRKQNEKYSKPVIITQQNTKYDNEDDRVKIFDNGTSQEVDTREVIFSMETEDLIRSKNILQAIDQVANKELLYAKDTLQSQNTNHKLKIGKDLHNYQNIVADLIKDDAIPSTISKKHLSHEIKQHLYIHNEPLTGIIIQNKCINILPRKFSNSDEQNKTKTQLNKKRTFTLLNKPTYAVNVKPNLKQNAIVLLTDDSLKNNIFGIDQSSTTNNEVKKQILEASK